MPFYAPWAGLVGKGRGGCNECCGFRAPSSTCSPTLASLEGFSATVWQLYFSQHPTLLPSIPDALPGVAPQGTPERTCTQIFLSEAVSLGTQPAIENVPLHSSGGSSTYAHQKSTSRGWSGGPFIPQDPSTLPALVTASTYFSPAGGHPAKHISQNHLQL